MTVGENCGPKSRGQKKKNTSIFLSLLPSLNRLFPLLISVELTLDVGEIHH